MQIYKFIKLKGNGVKICNRFCQFLKLIIDDEIKSMALCSISYGFLKWKSSE
jgi:hypothetical protein